MAQSSHEQTTASALTPPQAEILAHGLLDSGFNCVLQMPTGSGKTWLAFRAIKDAVAKGFRAVYLAPTRALASELYETWRKNPPEGDIGIFTGDYGSASRPYPIDFKDASVLLMTPERFDACTRNWRSHWGWLPEVDLVIVDEFHMLGDGLRGARLEGTLSRFRRLNPFARVLALSATLGNREELADWLDGVEYESKWRPIPLEWKIARFRKADEKPAILAREVARAIAAGGRSLVFAQSRRRAEFLAGFLRASDMRAEHHHAGLDHDERSRVEARFRRGDIDILVCTATLEVGLNLPARQVVLYDLQQFDGSDFRPLSTSSVWQRVGRAGRYGLDKLGEAVLIAPTWDKTSDRYPKGDFEPVRSQLGNRSWFAEQILVELASGLARNRSELASIVSESLAFRQGRALSLGDCVDKMLEAEMLREDSRAEDDTRELRLRPTRLGRVAVRHMLEPETVQRIRSVLTQFPIPNFFDLAFLVACTNDCEPVLPCDFEDLEQLASELKRYRSVLLSQQITRLPAMVGVSRKRLLAALKMAAVAMAWARTGDASVVGDMLNCYAYEVRRLTESMTRLLAATNDLLQPQKLEPNSEAGELTDAPKSLARKRAALLSVMIGHALDPDTASLTLVRGLGPIWARRLALKGISDVEELAQANPQDLARIKGLSVRRALEWTKKAELVIKDEDVWTSLDFGPVHSMTSRSERWPGGVDPYRLRRALQLSVANEGTGFLVTGGLDPHRVQSDPNGWSCDCADFAKGHQCKHALAVRLKTADPAIVAARTQMLEAQTTETPTLSSLWFAEEPPHEYETTRTNPEDSRRGHSVPRIHPSDHVREEIPA